MAEGMEGLDGSIAIVGMAGRFPGARDLGELWRNLRGGVESVRFLSRAEMVGLGAPAAALGDPAWVPAVALPDGLDEFDAPFFGISPREAEILDPQHRLFLEACWTALEDAGYVPDAPAGVTAVYGGATTSTYLLFNLARNAQVAATVDPLQLIVGNAVDSLATRVSYKLNLKGASHAVQCACSTSLVAVHLACQALLNQECDTALAGGVSINVGQRAGYRFLDDSILSPDGHCRAFDAAASGTVFGGGVGVVVLKRLEDALAARDAVRAVIRGSAVNNDGAVKVGYTAPSVDGQAAVVAEAISVAGVDAETIGYIEGHGTGTALGDPIEIQSLTKAFRSFTAKRGFAALGTVKSNIGHLDIAAGIAGLIKTVLVLEHAEIPPSLHFERPNPRVDFAASPVYVSRALASWKRDGEPRRAGVSSFGFGGTNAHVVLEEAPAVPVRTAADRPWRLLVLSAKTGDALAAAAVNLAACLRSRPEIDLGDAAYTLLAGRRTFGHRRIAVCRDALDAAACLAELDPERVLAAVEREEPRDRPLAFLFPGQGAQHVEMGRGLYENEPAFRDEVDRCVERLAPALGLDLRRVLYPDREQREEAERLLARTRLAQPALFVVEYALARLWMSWGIVPQAMIGHSIGEYVAACLAGVFTLEDALSLVAGRGRLIEALPEGAMLAVPLPAAEACQMLDGDLDLAAVNEPERSVVAGPLAAIERLEARLAGCGLTSRRLRTSHAFHSRMMEPAVGPFVELVRATRRSAPAIPFLSNVTGDFIQPEEATDPAYWGRHLRETVHFTAGIEKLLDEPDRLLLEVGPGRTLTTLAARQAAGRPSIASLRHPREAGSDLAHLLSAAGRLWLAGHRLDAEKLFAGQQRRRVPLPTYPFARHRYWIEPGDALPLPAMETTARISPTSQVLHARPALATAYVAPRGEVEERVAALWREVLGLAELGAHDSFLELGGDSLLATRLMARLREEFAVELAMERLFERPTIAGVAAALVEARAAAAGDDLARLLAEVQALSDEELESELTAEEGRRD
jgi:acyl transferase domain-containing protein